MYIYTDASLKNGVCIVTHILLDDRHFYGFNSVTCEDIPNSTIGEYMGIVHALQTVLNMQLPSTTELIIRPDSREAVELVLSKTGPCTAFLEEFFKVYKSVEFRVCVSHTCEHNPNKVCDLTSNSILRSVT